MTNTPAKTKDKNIVQVQLTDKNLQEAFGTAYTDAATMFLSQLMRTISPCETKDEVVAFTKQVMPLLSGIEPRDELEGMLAVQMVGIHALSMEMMGRAMISDQTVDGVNNNVNRVTKLTRTFIAQMEALDKHRGDGRQKITVEHVTVNEGGQAIVGNVEQGGRDEKKK